MYTEHVNDRYMRRALHQYSRSLLVRHILAAASTWYFSLIKRGVVYLLSHLITNLPPFHYPQTPLSEKARAAVKKELKQRFQYQLSKGSSKIPTPEEVELLISTFPMTEESVEHWDRGEHMQSKASDAAK